VGDFQIPAQVIHSLQYADELVLEVKEEVVLLGMFCRLIESGRFYGMEMNVEKTKVMKV
jgi:hypothetical protein